MVKRIKRSKALQERPMSQDVVDQFIKGLLTLETELEPDWKKSLGTNAEIDKRVNALLRKAGIEIPD